MTVLVILLRFIDHITLSHTARANYDALSQPQQGPWIVDTGATDHMASNAQNLTDVHTYQTQVEIVMGRVTSFQYLILVTLT